MALIPAIHQPSTNEAFLFLLTVTPASGAAPIRVVNNNEDITSRGDLFQAFPFSIQLALDDGEKQPEISLRVANASQEFITAIRELLDPPAVKLEMVLSGSPDTVEKSIDFLRLDNVEYDALWVSMTLRPINILGRTFPNTNYTGTEFPDLAYR